MINISHYCDETDEDDAIKLLDEDEESTDEDSLEALDGAEDATDETEEEVVILLDDSEETVDDVCEETADELELAGLSLNPKALARATADFLTES